MRSESVLPFSPRSDRERERRKREGGGEGRSPAKDNAGGLMIEEGSEISTQQTAETCGPQGEEGCERVSRGGRRGASVREVNKG